MRRTYIMYNPYLRSKPLHMSGLGATAIPDKPKSVVEKPSNNIPDYKSYVDSYGDLTRAYRKRYGRDDSKKEKWGKKHWENFGEKKESRSMKFKEGFKAPELQQIAPTPLNKKPPIGWGVPQKN